MNEKPWWQSVTIWGGIMAALAGPVDQICTALGNAALGAAMAQGLGSVGGVLAIYGRSVSTTVLTAK